MLQINSKHCHSRKQRANYVEVAMGPGETATIGDGPLRGISAEILTVDTAANLAQVRVRVRIGGQLRSGVAVVSLSALHRGTATYHPPAPSRTAARRGRPRQVTSEMATRMARMYASGQYTHASIAAVLGVSKSTVSHYLRHEPSEQLASSG
jgi:DNA-binding CsgD family transcriptional regulator